MRTVRIRRGLDLRMGASPEPGVHPAACVERVALLGCDLRGLRARPCVAVDEHVALGQPVLHCRERPGLQITAPGAGTVRSIERGARRSLRALVIDLEGDDAVRFPSHPRAQLSSLAREVVVERLLASGAWTALRARPYGGVAQVDSVPAAVLVTAMDSRPVALDVPALLDAAREDFVDGLQVLARLTDGPVFVCCAPQGVPRIPTRAPFETVAFAGPHPAGLPGTHVHHLAPVRGDRPAWHIGAQDVIALGLLFTRGRLSVERVIALGGPGTQRPRQLRTRLGADLRPLLPAETRAGHLRVIAGCVLHGRAIDTSDAFLGRYEESVVVLPEAPSSGARGPDTAVGGRRGPMLPLGVYARVWPLHTPVLPLLRALLVGDGARARALGCLDLDEEDLALCTYVCPGKQDYGSHLRAVLDRLEAEG